MDSVQIVFIYSWIQILFCRAATEDSKKWGMLFLVNQLLKIYFKVRNSFSGSLYWLFIFVLPKGIANY